MSGRSTTTTTGSAVARRRSIGSAPATAGNGIVYGGATGVLALAGGVLRPRRRRYRIARNGIAVAA